MTYDILCSVQGWARRGGEGGMTTGFLYRSVRTALLSLQVNIVSMTHNASDARTADGTLFDGKSSDLDQMM